MISSSDDSPLQMCIRDSERHHAIGTEVVAAVHHRQPRAVGARTAYRHSLADDAEIPARLRRGHGEALLLALGAEQKLGQQMQPVRPEQEIHIGIACKELRAAVLLLDHAAADGDEQVGPVRFELFKLTGARERAQLGVLAYGAGVDDDQIGLCGFADRRIAAQPADAQQLLAVRFVLLAAEGPDPNPPAAGRLQLGRDGLLPLDFGGRHKYVFFHSKYRSRM